MSNQQAAESFYIKNYTTANLFDKLKFSPNDSEEINSILQLIDDFNSSDPLNNYAVVVPGSVTKKAERIKAYSTTLKENFARPFELSEASIKRVHSGLFRHERKCKHAGQYKKENIVVSLQDTDTNKIYSIPVARAKDVDSNIKELISWFNKAIIESDLHPLLIIHLFIYEFVSIHPFEDGNGRTARIICQLLIEKHCYHFIKNGRFEYMIEGNRTDYIKTLYVSQISRGQGGEEIFLSTLFFLHRLIMMINEINFKNKTQKNILTQEGVKIQC